MKKIYINVWGQIGTKKDIISQGGDMKEFKAVSAAILKKYNIIERQWANTLDSLDIDYPECQKLWLSLN
jgi:hypothetical protein